MKIKLVFILLSGFTGNMVSSQEIRVEGKIIAKANLENIHVLNYSSKHFTVTNSLGQFRIDVKLNDTLIFSSVQYEKKIVVVNDVIMLHKTMEVSLEIMVNRLNEVTVGKMMIGDLESDMRNFEGKPDINFYDVGIPGYKGKPKTQRERRLNEAITGINGQKLKWYSPLTGTIPLNPIINGINGRTKRLKELIELEQKDDLLYSIISRLGEDFLSIYPLDEDHEMDFFYFCSDAPDFELRCKNKSEVEIFEYLTEKYKVYQENLKSHDD